MADKQAPSFYRYKVGDIQVNAIADGSLRRFPFRREIFVPRDAKLDEVQTALDKAFLPKDKDDGSCSPPLARGSSAEKPL